MLLGDRGDGRSGVVSSADFLPDGTRRDEGAYGFYHTLHETPPIVERVEVSEDGALRFALEGDFVLTVTPDRRAGQERRWLLEPDEQWRFLPGDDIPHVVRKSSGQR